MMPIGHGVSKTVRLIELNVRETAFDPSSAGLTPLRSSFYEPII